MPSRHQQVVKYWFVIVITIYKFFLHFTNRRTGRPNDHHRSALQQQTNKQPLSSWMSMTHRNHRYLVEIVDVKRTQQYEIVLGKKLPLFHKNISICLVAAKVPMTMLHSH